MGIKKLIKNYKELGHEEFMNRWKSGIKNTSQLSKTKVSLFGAVLMFIGVCIGIYTAIKTQVWWLLILLCGSFFLISVNLFTQIQRYLVYRDMENKFNKYKEVKKNE